MRKSSLAEILVLVLAGIGGILMCKDSLIYYALGFLVIFLDSCFVLSKLKEFTIKEYLEKINKKENKNVSK